MFAFQQNPHQEISLFLFSFIDGHNRSSLKRKEEFALSSTAIRVSDGVISVATSRLGKNTACLKKHHWLKLHNNILSQLKSV